MKRLPPVVASLTLLLFALGAIAQNSKKTLFKDFPSLINCKATLFDKALNAKEGQHITLEVSENFKFSGTVVSHVLKYGKMQTVVIRSEVFEGALLLVSKQNLPNNRFSYTGRIMSPLASDGYQIKQDEKGSFVFQKIDTDRLLETCAHP
ncbi:MAG: hypothetical protein IT254_04640 [Chitinophagaceae bacterium]|nr:hypothetical protein [Bacteroidota bacterium]MCC6257587.1 hypothetical protein [Chitinophagaceae bacterium]